MFSSRYGIGMLLALMLVHLRRDPDDKGEITPASRTATSFHSNGVPVANNKTARPRRLQAPLLLVGWAISLWMLWCVFLLPPLYAMLVARATASLFLYTLNTCGHPTN